MQSLIIAFSMYSRIPMPRADWDEKNMRYAFCWFPLVGLVIGLIQTGVWYALTALGAGVLLKGCVLAAAPLLVTGGIHLDGFMDTADARNSFGDREKKLDILKDPHIGAFAAIHCAVYMVLTVGLWSQADEGTVRLMIFAFALERALSGLAAVTMKNARGSGTLASFSEAAEKRIVTVILDVEAVLCVLIMLYIRPAGGGAVMAGAMAAFLMYRSMAMREFGGITGDLAGWFLQVCELLMLAAVTAVSLVLL